jgi:putative N6-adenine-specific DNA methylase
MRLRTFRSMTLEGLKYDLEKVAWHLFLDPETKIEVEVHTHRSRLNHSDEIADFTKETIAKLMPKIGSSPQHQQSIHIRIDNNRGVLSLDTSGERLDRRGYRLASGKAPLRETIAAAMLMWANWKPEQTLLVPMCGSGTIAIEAALLGLQKAPNIMHDFSLKHYPSFKEKPFQKAVDKCLSMEKDLPLHILASDNNESAITFCQENTSRAEVTQQLDIHQLDIHQLRKPASEHGGVLMLNPPYGQRIGDDKKNMSLWVDIGNIIRQQFLGDDLWTSVIICPDMEHEKALKLPIKQRLRIKHGGADVMLLKV